MNTKVNQNTKVNVRSCGYCYTFFKTLFQNIIVMTTVLRWLERPVTVDVLYGVNIHSQALSEKRSVLCHIFIMI